MNLAIVGFGNMGSAILSGAIRAGTLQARNVLIAEPDDAKRTSAQAVGAEAAPSADAVGAWLAGRGGGQVLLAIKPQFLADASAALRSGGLEPGTVVISILAGTPSAKVRSLLGGTVRVIRAMPNLPASIGHGATAICQGAGAQAGDDAFAAELFSAIGPLVLRVPETLMNEFTAIGGSGPAYLFYLAEAMERAAVEHGFTPDQASAIVRQTLLGASMLYAGSKDSPSQLRAAVTSRGGTTAAAVGVLDSAASLDTLVRAMHAARDRGKELAAG